MRKEQVFMAIARQLATLGTCDRAHVGAVIVREGRCVSWGYNGAPPGMPHCGDLHGYSTHGDPDMRTVLLKKVGCKNATHAEANALAFAARQGISTDLSTLYVTVAPCEVCARLIIAAGIEKVRYGETYRNSDGLKLLEQALIPCDFLG